MNKLLTIRHDDFDFRLPAKTYIDVHEEFIKAGLTETAVIQLTTDGRIPFYDPELIKYMQTAPNWEFAVHGWAHDRYNEYTVDTIVRDIGAAIFMIEKLFGKKPTIWYPPWNIYSGTMEAAASILGIKIDNENYDIAKFIRNVEAGTYDGHSLYFHAWNAGEMLHFPKMIECAKLVWGGSNLKDMV